MEIDAIPILTLENRTHYLSKQNPFHNTTMNATFLLLQWNHWSEMYRNIILEPGDKIESFVIPIDEKIDDEIDMYYGIFAEMTKIGPSGTVGVAFAYPTGVSPPQEPPPLIPLFPYPVENPGEATFVMYGYNSAPSIVGMGIYDLNYPPFKPEIFGPNSGRPKIPYLFRFNTIDPDGDEVSFFIKWGDGNITDWTQLDHGQYEETHEWDSRGNYIIAVEARDSLGLESEDANFEFPIYRYRANLGYSLLNLLNRFPVLFAIFKMIIKH